MPFAYSSDVWKADPFDVESIHAARPKLVRSHREPRAGTQRLAVRPDLAASR